MINSKIYILTLLTTLTLTAESPFRPKAGEFPPLEKAHAYRGELIFVDHPNRRGTIRVQGKTRPGAQWRVSRRLRVRIAEALAAAEIGLPPSTFVRSGGTPPPAR